MKKLLDCFAPYKRIILLAFFVFFLGITGFTQIKITGVVTGKDNVPLKDATVTIKNSNLSTFTGPDGTYSIDAKKGDVMVVSYIGFKSKQIDIGTPGIINVSLELSVINLNEILLTGYTAQKAKEITGSIAVVKAKELTAVPAGQVEQMLQGRVAGLTVITSGEPGAPSQIYLHGIGNFGNNTPLYIIDGVEGNINTLNPYDVESILVLKDAGAYSIYGVRGANGVIVATTKKGKSGKAKLTYDFYIGSSRPLTKELNILSPQEEADLKWMASKNSGFVDANGNPSDPLYGNGPKPVLPDYLFAGPYLGLFKGDPYTNPDLYNLDSTNGAIYQIVPFNKTGTDWFHELFKPAFNQNHTLTVSGGGDKNHYLLSFGYLDQQGTYINTYLKRFTTRVNTEFTILDNIRIGENLQLSGIQNPRVGNIDPARSTYPFLPVYDINGNSSSYGPAAPWGYAAPSPEGNPVTERLLTVNDKNNNWQVFGNAFAEVDLFKKFTFRTSFGGALNYFYSYNFYSGTYEPPPTGSSNSFSERSAYGTSWTWTNTLTYSGTFGKGHHIKAFIGTEQKDNYNRELGGSRRGYASNDPNYLFLSTGRPNGQTNYSFASTSYLSSLLSQVEYGYSEKYFVTGTLRRDGSSVFGPESRYGWFPAVGIAWRMTEENFMEESKWVTDLKWRASWGKTGFDGNTNPANQYTLFGGGPGSAYYDISGVSTGVIQQGYRPVRFGNAKTSWQQDVVTNIGLDAILWNGKLSITADWYNKNSTGLLFGVSLPALLGEATPPNINVGDVKNTGIDLKIGSKGSFSKNCNWDMLVTFSHYNNKIVHLNDLPYFDDVYLNQSPLIRNEVGYPVSSFFGYKVIGYFNDSADVAKSPVQEAAAPGRFKYFDANGDGEITDADRVHFGNPNPTFTLGFNIGINYKNFDFSTFFYGSFGNELYNLYKNTTNMYVLGGPKVKTALYDSWTPQHHDAKAPLQEYDFNFSNAGVANSYGMEDGSYFRNKSLIIGYTFPKQWLQKIKVERLRIYLQAMNLFTITNYTGLDPELSGSSSAFGIDYSGNYPNNQQQYLLGINLAF